jgi:phosphoglycolate phosphatase-like HAD superfamily hydrolase
MSKTVIFDFDGTIADTFPIVEGIAHEIAKRYGIEMTTAEGRAIGLKQIIKQSKFPTLKIPQLLIEVKHRLGLKIKDEVNPFAEMDRVLNNLSRKFNLGIISSNSESNIKSFLEKHQLLGLFNYIHSDSSLFGKDLVLKRFCWKYKVNYCDIVYIGDEDRDISAAKKLEIKVIAVTWGYNDKGLLEKEKPDYLVDRPEQILEVLNNMLSINGNP